MVSPEFKKGDKVRLVEKKYYPNGRCNLHVGDIYTIKKCEVHPRFYRRSYEVEECPYVVISDEIELVTKADTVHLTIDIPANDKKEAHKIAHVAVEDVLRKHAETKAPVYGDWTLEEIRTAQDAIAKLVHYVTVNGGDISWAKDNRGNIWCRYRRDLYEPFNKANKGMAKKMSEDAYNEWIGKYVSLCHAMRFPLPEFIRFKNVKQ